MKIQVVYIGNQILTLPGKLSSFTVFCGWLVLFNFYCSVQCFVGYCLSFCRLANVLSSPPLFTASGYLQTFLIADISETINDGLFARPNTQHIQQHTLFTDNGTVRATPSLQNFNGSFQLCLCDVPADSKKRKACLLNCSKPNMKLKVGLSNSHGAADFGFLKLKTRQLVSNNFYLCFPAICIAPKHNIKFQSNQH